MNRIEIRLLGRPRVDIDGEATNLGVRQLHLVARLAVAGAPLPLARLRDDVWGGTVGPGAVRVALSRLRTQLGDEIISRSGAGYALRDDVWIDVEQFERLVDAASDRSRPTDERRRSYREAASLWRGPALDGVTDRPWALGASVRLDELRERAVDDALELSLQSGASADVIVDARAAVELDPTRERRAELLAIALYRAGRQTEALAVLSRLRRRLREQLGLLPSPAVADLEGRILRHDPALSAASSVPSGSVVGSAAAPPTSGLESELRATSALVRIGADEEALEIVDRVIDEAERAGDERTAARALLMRARVGTRREGGDPHADIDRAQAIARRLVDAELLAAAAIARFGSGVPEVKSSALIELMEPYELLPPEAPQRLDLLCAAAVIVTFIDASVAAERLLDVAEQQWVATPSDRAEAIWLSARTVVHAVRRAPLEELADWAERALELARGVGDPTVTVVAMIALLRVRYAQGRLDEIDEMLDPLAEVSDEALLPFGSLRAELCRTTNALCRGELDGVPDMIDRSAAAGRRLRAHAAEGGTLAHRAMWLREMGAQDDLRALAGAATAGQPPGPWHALLAWAGDESAAADLGSIALEVPNDDYLLVFTALAAEVACRRSDLALAEWCSEQLTPSEGSVIVGGLGTVVLGPAARYLALARRAVGDARASLDAAETARTLSERSKAPLWIGHDSLGLAAALRTAGVDGDRPDSLLLQARRIVDDTGSGLLGHRVRLVERTPLGSVTAW